MSPVIPPSFLFRYEIPVPRLKSLDQTEEKSVLLPKLCQIPWPAGLNGKALWADVRVGWHPDGFAVSLLVENKTGFPACNPSEPEQSDSLFVWIDTRDTQTIHRASRYCHLFYFLPTGSGRGAKSPVGQEAGIARAKESHPLADSSDLNVQSEVRKDGYSLRAEIPAKCLKGYDPENSPRLGFYCAAFDVDHGAQTLSVDSAFPFDNDPSLWSTLQLEDA
ncbi:DOMON domain-containing protein [Thalassoroseus pseudoceratinae]|uniref:hypothetical protein n=1 Tax=Thalassoroseus pseudoceratinae TaxID=2713176 RepID=UPI00142070BD|nr:hypothetical protein [Thalassoroseus pseudoceratinae]